ncbi:hypothetical protein O1M63_18125 [Streptomyces mirabilis]|nr:hypothetical protein [Streptomyces mirabilis]
MVGDLEGFRQAAGGDGATPTQGDHRVRRHLVQAPKQPGKILHEVRRGALQIADRLSLPTGLPRTVDATPLWITLLHDAWHWGLEALEVEQLLPHAESALAWMRDQADADSNGFLTHVDRTGRGLANQALKDSADAFRHRDGHLAAAPIALCEVQRRKP